MNLCDISEIEDCYRLGWALRADCPFLLPVSRGQLVRNLLRSERVWQEFLHGDVNAHNVNVVHMKCDNGHEARVPLSSPLEELYNNVSVGYEELFKFRAGILRYIFVTIFRPTKLRSEAESLVDEFIRNQAERLS